VKKALLEAIERGKKEFDSAIYDFWEWRTQLAKKQGWEKLSFKKVVEIACEARARAENFANLIKGKKQELLNSKIVDRKQRKELQRIISDVNSQLFETSIFLSAMKIAQRLKRKTPCNQN
jgi:hypothetical protein